MGRYAKSSALHAEAIDSYIKQFVHMMSPDFVQFICTVERLYKAIALWSLLEPCLKKLRREQYGEGESFSSLAELCCSFVDEINSLYKEIQAFPQPTSSPYYVFGLQYFEKIIFPKTLEYKICEVYVLIVIGLRRFMEGCTKEALMIESILLRFKKRITLLK